MKKKIICFVLSVMLITTFVPQISFADTSSDISVITGFEPLETTDYYYEGNPDEKNLTVSLPNTLTVYINGSKSTCALDVKWEAVENFDDTDFYYYSMKPVWEKNYILSNELNELFDVPWITLYKREPEIAETKQLCAEDELECIYTDENGPILPDDESLGDTAKSLLNLFIENSYAANASNADIIYKYLTTKMGLNMAAACGVMANIYAESAMKPDNLQNTYNTKYGLSDEKYTSRVDKSSTGAYKTSSGTSNNFKTDAGGYGLCQWTFSGRKTNLLNKAKSTSVSVGDINMQLDFLNTELKSYNNVYTTLTNVPNNAGGAFIAAEIFCLSYEIPANTVATAASRAKNCLSGYWQTYSGSSGSLTGKSFISLCGYSYPSAVKLGKGMDVKGYAVSNYNVKSITGTISDSQGKKVYSKTISADTTATSLGQLDSYMKFSKLDVGKYTYTVSAKDSTGKTVTAKHIFSVKSNGSTIPVFGFKSVAGSAQDASDQVKSVKKSYSGKWPSLPKRGYFKKGDKGTQVKRLQKFLNWYGNYGLKVDGSYGSKTLKAVNKFKKKVGMKQNGKFGKIALKKAKAVKK